MTSTQNRHSRPTIHLIFTLPLLGLFLTTSSIAEVSPAYNSYSFRGLTRSAYNYVPSGSFGRTYTGKRTLRDRAWWRFQSADETLPTGTTMHYEAGWTQTLWTQSPGPIVKANHSTRIRWGAYLSWMLEFEKSDTQRSRYSCDAIFDGDQYFYHPPGSASWVRAVNPAFNWPREIFIEVNWSGVVGGLQSPTILQAIGIPSPLSGQSGTSKNTRSGLVAGTRWNGYVSIGTPEGSTAQSHSTGWIDQF